MADEAPKHNPWEPLIFIGLVLGGLFVLWWVRGGPQHAPLTGQGLFISPTAPQNTTTNP